MAQIIIYKTPVCPYCNKAKGLLVLKGVGNDIEERDISTDTNLMKEMLEKSGGMKSVPQIFINDTHVGGCDELYTLDREGKLDQLLGK